MNVLFEKILQTIQKQQSVVLATVIAKDGSSPRGIGTQMLIGQEGRLFGTIGGGAVEQRCEETAQQCLLEKRSMLLHYDLHLDSTDSIGMVCGGDVSIFVQFIDCKEPEWAVLTSRILSMLSEHRPGWLALKLNGDFPALFDEDGNLLVGEGGNVTVHSETDGCKRTDSCFVMPLSIRERAVVFGGGHCAQALVPLLAKVGFRVTVMDNRHEFATPSLFQEAEKVICGDYLNLSDYLTLTSSDYVVIMTNGHNHDFDILRQILILQNPPAYVGVIGSRRKKAFVNAKLQEEGIADSVIERIHSPIGMAIKAVTPAEIAISIIGEMIYVRALHRESGGTMSHKCPMQ